MNPVRNTRISRKKSDTVSPDKGESVFILVGKIRRPHGIMGEILLQPYSETDEHFFAGKVIYIGKDYQAFTIESSRNADAFRLIHLEGVSSPEEAGLFRNKDVYVSTESLPPLADGEYYKYQLIGLSVEDEKGTIIGVLNEVIFTGANDVYSVISEEGQETLIPAIPSVILSIDINQKKMVVRPQEWL